VRNIEDLGYTYPELIGRPDNSTLKANIKHQYDDSLPTTVTKRQDQAEPAKGLVYLAEVKLALYGFTDGNGSSQPYNVLTFLGDVPSEPTEWLQAESFVAITSATGGHRMTKNLSSTMLVDLTDALAKAGKKPDKAAVEFLKENLHWRLGLVGFSNKAETQSRLMVIQGDFEIKRAEIPGVEVKLLSTEVEFSNRDDDFDHWVGDFTDYGLVDA
jgi:tyrosinase